MTTLENKINFGKIKYPVLWGLNDSLYKYPGFQNAILAGNNP